VGEAIGTTMLSILVGEAIGTTMLSIPETKTKIQVNYQQETNNLQQFAPQLAPYLEFLVSTEEEVVGKLLNQGLD